MGGMARQKISIHSENMIGYLEFLMGHPDFWNNKIYKSSCIFNENEYQIYNEIHTDK